MTIDSDYNDAENSSINHVDNSTNSNNDTTINDDDNDNDDSNDNDNNTNQNLYKSLNDPSLPEVLLFDSNSNPNTTSKSNSENNNNNSENNNYKGKREIDNLSDEERADNLHQNLIAVWESLEIPMIDRLKFVAKYSEEDKAILLPQVLQRWKDAAIIIRLRERILTTCRSLQRREHIPSNKLFTNEDQKLLTDIDCFIPTSVMFGQVRMNYYKYYYCCHHE